MKAMVIHAFGGPDVLSYETVPDPVPRHGEVRIEVHGATVNRVLDVAVRAGTQARKADRRCVPKSPGTHSIRG